VDTPFGEKPSARGRLLLFLCMVFHQTYINAPQFPVYFDIQEEKRLYISVAVITHISSHLYSKLWTLLVKENAEAD
jgi:hypothetical protein